MRQRKRPLVEDCRQVALRQMPPLGQRAWLRWVDERGELVAVATLKREAEAVAISYRWREGDEWRETRQTTRLVASEPPLGGVCHFLACPQCGRRALKLFDVKGGVFGCRRCEGLANRSQSQGAWERALLRARKIRRRLGAEGDAGAPLPSRPKGMRWRTYEALVAEAKALEALPLGAWLTDGRGVALGVRRSTMGAKGRCRWWLSRNRRAA
jgi:hypothetical protein